MSPLLYDALIRVGPFVDRAPAFAARATLLSTEALKSKGMYAEAATLLIKMTSEVGTGQFLWPLTRALCRRNCLPVTHFLVDVNLYTYKSVEMCFMI